MTRNPGRPDPLIAYAPGDGSLDVFVDFEETEGRFDVVDVLEPGWTVFYSLDGEVLVPESGRYDWVERLTRTNTYDLPGLTKLLTQYAHEHGFDTDGTDPRAFADEMIRRDYEGRWPKWPRWLDRRIHGGPRDE